MKNNKFEEFKMRYFSWVMLFLLMGCSPSPEFCRNEILYGILKWIALIIGTPILVVILCLLICNFISAEKTVNQSHWGKWDYFSSRENLQSSGGLLLFFVIFVIFLLFQGYRCFI